MSATRLPSLGALILSALPLHALAEVNLATTALTNRTAYIPPQCYTRTEDAAGGTHNPCQTCHVAPRAPNYVNDASLQEAYAFPAPGLVNPWRNLFADRRAAIAATDRAEMLAYVRQSNYLAPDGMPLLAQTLATPPAAWDVNADGRWGGYTPDAYFAFDAEGFDHAPDGTASGWRAFAYQPLPGTFWPANGSADDVLIRLAAPYRQDAQGVENREVYKANLAIAEALITRADVTIPATDEAALGLDLDRDGTLGQASRVAFAFDPRNGITMHWAGLAGTLPPAQAPLAAGLYPLGTEFLHSVRYLDVTEAGVGMAARLKELRYMRKTRWLSYADLEEWALAEKKEDADFPDRTKQFFGNAEEGIPNGTGWRLQGFIEDAAGSLRPQSFEETVFCIGCHSALGTLDDATFAFPRKLGAEAFQGGWYHWSQKGLAGTPERRRTDGAGEYAHYLRTNGAGDEFRANAELIGAWLEGGALPEAKAAQIAADIGPLVTPSPERALALDAAYRLIVREQSFAQGRDATLAPMDDFVWPRVEDEQPTGIATPERAWHAGPRR